MTKDPYINSPNGARLHHSNMEPIQYTKRIPLKLKLTRCASEKVRTTFRMLIVTVFVSGNAFAAMISTERAMNPYPRKKEIPAFTLANLAPPYLEHTYFEGQDLRPFQAHAASFDLANAWWLAEASALAYADEAFAAEWFRKAGFDEVRFFDKRSTQCFVASNREFAVVAFRGSEVWRRRGANDGHDLAADFTTNANFWLVDWAHGAKVHRGFKNALDEVWEDLFPYLAVLQRRGCKIWMTGHSLGAALATLAADRFGEVQGVYTFGSPRVGDRRFKEVFSIRTYRFVNGNDIVARLPPPGFYAHVGEPRFIDYEGRIRGRMTESTHDRYNCAGECGEKISLEKNNLPKTPVFVPDAVIDHVPLLYAVLIWNNLVETPPGAE